MHLSKCTIENMLELWGLPTTKPKEEIRAEAKVRTFGLFTVPLHGTYVPSSTNFKAVLLRISICQSGHNTRRRIVSMSICKYRLFPINMYID